MRYEAEWAEWTLAVRCVSSDRGAFLSPSSAIGILSILFQVMEGPCRVLTAESANER